MTCLLSEVLAACAVVVFLLVSTGAIVAFPPAQAAAPAAIATFELA